MNDPILEMRGVSKSFFGIKALRAVDLTVHTGEIHALMGENGAGKSTLMKILSGAYQADPGGEILIDGQTRRASPTRSRPSATASPSSTRSSPRPEPDRRGEHLSRRRDPQSRPDRPQGDARERRPACSSGWARPSRRRPSSASCRSPSSSSSRSPARCTPIQDPGARRADHRAVLPRDASALFALIRQLRGEGIAIIYISHRMAEVYELADRVSVLRDGAMSARSTARRSAPTRSSR